MMPSKSPFSAFALPKFVKALASAATLFTLASAAQAQLTTNDTVFSDNFDSFPNPPSELTAGQTTSGGAGPTGWVTSDPDNLTVGSQDPTTLGYVAALNGYVGGSNYVGPFPGTNFADTYGGELGGEELGNFDSSVPASATGNFTVLPTQATSYLYHSFALPATTTSYTFSVDSTITTSSTAVNANSGAMDSFAYTFRSGTGTLFSINFTPDAAATARLGTAADAITYSLGGSATQTPASGVGAAVELNGRYHFSITVNPLLDTFSLTYSASGVSSTPFTNVSLLSLGSLSTAITPQSVTQVAATWTLANTTTGVDGAYVDAGSNQLIFDNYSITSVDLVPEPSTYAMMGVGFLGLIGMMKFRRRRA